MNGADARSVQMFTLAHELAHIWLGTEGLSGFEPLFPGGTDVEDWCNRAAAELLAPEQELRAHWMKARRAASPFEALARTLKVSPVVAARRALDLEIIGRNGFVDFYAGYVSRERRLGTEPGAGEFYNNQNERVGELFTTQVLRAAMEAASDSRKPMTLQGCVEEPSRSTPSGLA